METSIMNEPADRMMAALPAIYRATDDSGQLRALLRGFEAMLLDSGDAAEPAIAQDIDVIPELFSPLGVKPSGELATANGLYRIQANWRSEAPERFLAWLAQWVAFSPYPLFPPERLRRIIAGIVPLYGSRGTRHYLEKLLALCFDEVTDISIDEEPLHGFLIGRARLGTDTVLATDEPFRFRVAMVVREHGKTVAGDWEAFEERVRAIVDFARPAHTEYELVLRRGTGHAQETADQ
jgi:phage tail-like protein